MKKAMIAMVIASALGLTACQKEAADTTATNAPVELKTEADKQAYALGASVGMFVDRKLDAQEEVGLGFDKELVIKGFIASLNEKSQFTPAELNQITQAAETAFKAKQEEQQDKVAATNLEEGKKFLEENAKKEGVMTTESGLQYQVMTEGEGDHPVATDTVKVHYKGTLLNGKEFDSSYSRGEPAVFPLNRVISGWTEGVQLMTVGSKYKFFIPAELAYGERNMGDIGANSTLIFEVELLDIIKPDTDAGK